MSTEAPERSLVQRMEALQTANRIRTTRAQFKRELGRGEKTRKDVFNLLLEPTEDFETMKAFELLLSIRGFGRVKVDKIFRSNQISPSKTLGGMTQRQRAQLAAYVL